MTKKKITILLSSILAGVGLVGATFAAWAVTDNANPFGIKISPGNISADTYDTLVLDWGDRTEFTNISGLELGESNAVYLPLGVRANASKTYAYGGNLSISLEDQTVHAQDAPELIDHLVVKVYETRTGTAAPYGYSNEIAALALNGATPVIEANADIETPLNGNEKTLYFKIYIDATGLDVNKYNQMKNDIVYLKLDWNKPSTMTDLVTGGYTVYYTPLADYVPNIYAWNSETLIPNAEYPGVPMTLFDDSNPSAKIYSYELKAEYDKVIFSKDGDTTPAYKVTDKDVPTAANKSAGEVFFNGTSWTTLPSGAQPEVTYWLIGSMNNWTSRNNTYKFTVDPSDSTKYTLNISVEGNQDMKVIDGDNVTFWDEDERGTSDETEVFHLGEAGNYLLEFYPNGHDNIYLHAEKLS